MGESTSTLPFHVRSRCGNVAAPIGVEASASCYRPQRSGRKPFPALILHTPLSTDTPPLLFFPPALPHSRRGGRQGRHAFIKARVKLAGQRQKPTTVKENKISVQLGDLQVS